MSAIGTTSHPLRSVFSWAARVAFAAAKVSAFVGVIMGAAQGLHGRTIQQGFFETYGQVGRVVDFPQRTATQEWGEKSWIVGGLRLITPAARFWCGTIASGGAAVSNVAVNTCRALFAPGP